MPSPVVTRIAPSPTGAMHIGNARAALFNWLYARHTGGTFLLRIEDTDRVRSTESSVQVIFDSLTWLGLAWDGEPVFQHARADLHRDAVDRLMASGHAYRCYMTTEEADAAKEKARAEGHALRSPWRDLEAGHNQVGQPHVIRFRTPMDGETVIDDMVRGRVAFPNKDLEDFVLLIAMVGPCLDGSVRSITLLVVAFALTAHCQNKDGICHRIVPVQSQITAGPVRDDQLSLPSGYRAANHRAGGQHIDRRHDGFDTSGRVLRRAFEKKIKDAIKVILDLVRQDDVAQGFFGAGRAVACGAPARRARR